MKIRIFAATLLALIICLCPFTVLAETLPEYEDITPTEDVFATEEPDYTEPADITEPDSEPDYTEPAYTETYATESSDYTEPYTGEETGASDYTEPTDITTEVHTNPPAPTEPDEDSTYSDYVSPAPIYTPADQDFQEKDWQEIELDLSADPAPGKQSFADIQNDKSKGNDSIMGFLIGGIVLIFAALAGFTFVFLYNPYKKKKAPAKTGGARYADSGKRNAQPSNRAPRENRRPFNPDDYNDGF